jgi:2-keto-4-pentenoate hydratase/2-oxohepta-3-ene-1,7-dioic acid hydratase in catechol pathway
MLLQALRKLAARFGKLILIPRLKTNVYGTFPMKYCRFQQSGQAQFGLVEPVAGNEMITAIIADPCTTKIEEPRPRKISAIPIRDAVLLVPVQPSKIVCVGRNYREHAAELGHEVPKEPLIFLKPPSALLDPGQKIIRPQISARVDHEGELGVVIGKTCRHLHDDQDVRDYILGYTSVNDVTARDLQNKDGQWTRAKGFDTFCPVGPVVSDEVDPWTGVAVETRVNGNIRQQGNTRDFIFTLDVVMRHIAQVMTLLPGDLIATGTPSGVGPLVAGDVVEVTVQGIGTLGNPVADR